MYAVQKKIPEPPRINAGRRTGRRKYPFEELEVGDMFFVPGKTRNALGSHVSVTGKELGRKFSARTCYMRQDADGGWDHCDENADGATLGVGVWRKE